ncbi:MAG: response regulator transcription factor [Rubrivivax sp.]|nr:response regulator transcription factor [Rubrivivax sp.]
MTRALIAEDEPLLCDEIREELGRVWPDLAICALAHDGHAAHRAIENLRPEVLFLDVQLPGLTGLELARLAGRRAHIVFITAFDHYAVQAFDEGAVDYLLKPLDSARLVRATQRLKERLGQVPADLGKLVDRARQLAPAAEPLRWISVLHGREIRLITVEDICYFRADNKYVAVVTVDGESLISTPLKDLLAKLDPAVFWQVHRGTVVNLSAVRSLSRDIDGSLSLHLKQRPETLKVGSSYAGRFRQL